MCVCASNISNIVIKKKMTEIPYMKIYIKILISDQFYKPGMGLTREKITGKSFFWGNKMVMAKVKKRNFG